MPLLRSMAARWTVVSLYSKRSQGFAWAVMLLAAVLIGGCGEDTAAAKDAGPVDAGPTIDIEFDSTTGDAAGTDAVAPIDTEPSSDGDAQQIDGNEEVDVSKCPGAAGCPCSSVDQCASNFCIDTPKGQQCAAKCFDGCPDATFKCSTVSAPGGDEVNICVPRWGSLCNPCSSNEKCQGPGNGNGRCVAQGNAGSFCGVGCSGAADCPADYECKDATDVAGQTSKQCVVKDGAACTCTEAAMNLQLSTKCYNVAGDNKCEGKRTCLLDGQPGAPVGGGLTACIAGAPVDEICDGKDNDCDGQTDEATCDDKNPCTDDQCGAAEGCKYLSNVSPCDADSSKCTPNDACLDGKCVAGKALTCDDGNECTTDSCDPAKGCQYPNFDGNKCDADNNPCTVNDVCKDGQCAQGPKKPCVSDDTCVDAKCDAATGTCKYPKKPNLPCNDGNPCTMSDKCGGADGGTCQGVDTNCDDKNSCTADSCDTATGCLHAPINSGCDDGNACTTGDACQNGACVGPKVQSCDDANPCTNDSCDPTTGCVHTGTSGNPCDDGNPCTAPDLCQLGKCEAGLNSCGCAADIDCVAKEDGNYCNGTLYCDKAKVPFACQINPLSLVACDVSVNNQCQTNGCDPATGACVLAKKADTTPCDADGNACTASDACFSGQCLAGAPSVCNDKNACTDDSCDGVKGCVYTPNKNPCDADATACTQGDACVAGSCVPGKTVVCTDSEGCTKDVCDPKTGLCSFTPLVQTCSDNNVCTTGDACGADPTSGKYTCMGGKSSACDDSNPCTVDLCDPGKGCNNIIDASLKVACYEGDPASKGKGQCKDGLASCGADGKTGACGGQVLPGVGDPCDGVDNNCDGIVDPGCAPTAFTAHLGNASISGAGTQFFARGVVGMSGAPGYYTGSGNYSVRSGFIAWVKAYLGL